MRGLPLVAIPTARGSEPIAAAQRRESERLAFPDAIRACAIVLVVVLHGAAPLVVRYPHVEPGRWWTANLLDSLARPCVPLFVMVSGMLLLDPKKDPSLRAFFARRFTRVLVPFLAWALIYLAWRVAFHGEAISPARALREIVQGPVYTHFWFVYMLLGLYLATPILRLFVRVAGPEDRRYFLVLWLVTVSLLPLLRRFANLEIGIGFVVTTGFVGYFLLGYHLRDVVLGPRQMAAALTAFVLLTAFTAIASWAVSARAGAFEEFFYGNLTPNVIAMSACAFLVLRALPYERFAVRTPRAFAVMRVVAEASFTIYLLHMIVVESILYAVPGLGSDGLHPLLGVPLLAGAVVALCTAVALLLRRVPYLRVIAP
jgi:surface polysaccharide O-acyltransferase-like enzyme